MLRRATSSAFAVVLLASAPLRAGDGSNGEPVRVEYAAPRECPTQPAFEAALAEHLGTATLARLGELARTLSVVIEREPQGFRARVELVDRDGRATQRDLSAPTCEQSMRAIALVAALAARSQADQAERERGEAREPAAANPATEPDPGAPPPLPLPAKVEPAPRAAPEPAEPPPPRPPATPRDQSRLVGSVSGGLGAATGVGPGAAPGLFVAGRLGFDGAPERSLVLTALGYDTFRRSLDVADVRFSVLKGRLELCPIEPRLSVSVVVSPCAGFELGSQTGRSYPDAARVETPHTVSRLWAAATLAARLRLRLGALELGGGTEIGFPLTRNTYTLAQPQRPVYEVPLVTVGLTASAGVAW